jgi:predicted permease
MKQNREVPGRFLDGLGQDLRFALRQAARRPGFTLLVVLTLAVGIGANVAIFSVMKGLILRELPYPDAEQVVAIWETTPEARWYMPFQAPDYFDMREQNSSLEEIGVYNDTWINLAGEEGAARVLGIRCTAGVLRVLGISPRVGRLFNDEEEVEGNHRVTILSDRLWKRYFGAAPDIVGSAIRVNGESYTVVGVMPEGYEFPRPWTSSQGDAELWIPIVLDRDRRGSHWLVALGRLRDGVTVERAEADLRAMADRLADAYPDTNSQVQVWIDPLMRRSLGGVRSFLLMMLGVVGLVLLIACANVASMLLARGTARTTELAIRASVGAARKRLIRQLLTESLVLSTMGGLAGVMIAFWGVNTVKGLIPPEIPRVGGIQIDGMVLLFGLIVTAMTGLLFGLAPALFASGKDLLVSLREGRGSQAGGRKQKRLLGGLVVAQLAMAFVLANGAALFIVSYLNVAAVPRAFDTEQVLVAGLSVSGPGYDELHGRFVFWERLLERVEALPGVEYAAATNRVPLRGGNNGSVLVEGETYDREERRPVVEWRYVAPDYFPAMGISLLSGRLLERRDVSIPSGEAKADRVIVVNQAFVERYWPGESALGKRVRHNSEPPAWTATIVGVVESTRQWGLEVSPLPEVYAAHSYQLRPYTRLVVRVSGDPLALVPAVRRVVRDIDSQIPVAVIGTMEDVARSANQRRRFYTLLVGLFAVTALILVVAGTYGVMSYYVSQRTHEIGVRVALGADKSRVLRLFVSQGLRLVLVGVAVGLAGALATASLTESMVFGISALHPFFLASGALFMTLVALAAISVPVFRAMRVDPNQALRTE